MSMEEYLDPFTGEEIKKTKNSTPLGVAGKVVQLADLLGLASKKGL